MKRLTVALSLVLTGCAGQVAEPPEPAVVRVEVPVQIPCRAERVPRPVFAVDVLPIGASIDEQMRALRSERLQRKAYEVRLEAAIDACK
ncbi:hypothetical protein CXP40_16385 [Pseudomonas sp. YY-1]|uniref:hypothetical protein n=1 Tax=Pseudomonas sp. YY-1 TaxID=2058659 RepID=UPI000CAD6151|nr:hypothetical protein [Pseudomonas sp. YY-1]PKQ40351.1 hypothetical protein CXP40_16385 [Pseudomonas sp. YY-1]